MAQANDQSEPIAPDPDAARGSDGVDERDPADDQGDGGGGDLGAEDIPEGITADYENTPAQEALAALQGQPDYEHLAAFLVALREGYLVVDVTGARKKDGKKGTRARTIRSTKGQLVLPIFTSMAELRRAVTDKQKDQLKGALMPARKALALIGTDRFVAAEIDKSSPSSLVLLRKYVSLAAGDEPITAQTLEGMRS